MQGVQVVIDSRVDFGVGFAFRVKPWVDPNRCFHSFLLCVEAKLKDNLESAYGQLVTYLECLRESRIYRGKPDSSVYGMVTDGFKYVFVCITNEGVLRLSRQFDVMQEDLPVILGCLGYILEKAIAMSSKFSPKTGVLQTEQIDNDFDEGFNPDDKSFLGYGDECMYELY